MTRAIERQHIRYKIKNKLRFQDISRMHCVIGYREQVEMVHRNGGECKVSHEGELGFSMSRPTDSLGSGDLYDTVRYSHQTLPHEGDHSLTLAF